MVGIGRFLSLSVETHTEFESGAIAPPASTSSPGVLHWILLSPRTTRDKCLAAHEREGIERLCRYVSRRSWRKMWFVLLILRGTECVRPAPVETHEEHSAFR